MCTPAGFGLFHGGVSMGKIYQRGKSGTWWIEYQHNGKQIRKSTKQKTKAVADRMLKQIEGQIAESRTPGIQFDKTTFDDMKNN